jgi:hypothetical protein
MKKILQISVTAGILGLYSLTPPLSNATVLQEQSEYLERYVDAVNNDHLEKLKSLSHPKFLKCITTENSDYYNDLFRRSLQRHIPKNYKVLMEKLIAESVERDYEGAKKRGLPYPARPTHQLQIDYSKSEYSFVTIVRKLILENGQYYEVSGCPTDDMLIRYRNLKIKKEADQKKAKALFEKLEGSLLDDLKSLLQEGRKIDAWKRYSQGTGESLATAKAVLSHIKLDD